MTPESVMMMGTEAMKVALALAAPLLLVALVTGLIISILQAATEQRTKKQEHRWQVMMGQWRT